LRVKLIALTAALLAIWPGAVLANEGGVTHRDLTEVSLSSNPIVPGGLPDWRTVQEMFRRGIVQNQLLALWGRWLDGQTPESIQEYRWMVYWLADAVLKAKSPEEMGAALERFDAGGPGGGPYLPMLHRLTAHIFGMTFRGSGGRLTVCQGRVVFNRAGSWSGWVIPVKRPDGRMMSFVIWKDCGNVSLLLDAKPERVEVERRVETPGPERVRTEYVPVEVPGPERVREVPIEVPVYVTEYRDREVMVKVPVEVPGPERVEYRDRVTCQERVVCASPVLTGPRGTSPTPMLRAGWTAPTFEVLVTGGIILMPSHAPAAPAQTNPPPDDDVPCPPGGEPNPGTLPPGVNPPPPPTVPVPLEPDAPGPPPVTGPGSEGEVGTNTQPPSTPNPDNSTVPVQIPNLPPDTTGLLPPG